MKIAFAGIRGIPANYGGFETFVEEVAARLVARGHEAWVYCRARYDAYGQPVYRGVRRIVLPSLRSKHLDTVSHTFLALVHAVAHRADVLHVCNVGNGILLPITRLARQRTVLSLDALEWRRAKWDGVSRLYLKAAERAAVRWADELIADSQVVGRYYAQQFGRRPAYVAYGAHLDEPLDETALRTYGLERGRYLLFVGRLVPEKGVHRLLAAYQQLQTDLPLVIVGDDPYGRDYVESLKRQAPPGVRFLGFVYGAACAALYRHVCIYVQPSEVDGTSPSLLTAMGHGCCVLVNGIPEHGETIGDAGWVYRANDVEDLAAQLRFLLAHPEVRNELGRRARARIASTYTWDRIVDDLEAIYLQVARRGRPMRPVADGRFQI